MKDNKCYQNSVHLRFLGHFVLLFVIVTMYSLNATAQDIEQLQKNASITYEKMMQAKQSAENLEKDFISAEKKLTEAKEKLAAAEREATNAKKKSDQAKAILEQAVNHWKKASDDLANEWGKSEVK